MILYSCGHYKYEYSRETKSKGHQERKGSKRVSILNMFAKQTKTLSINWKSREDWPVAVKSEKTLKNSHFRPEIKTNTILGRQRKYLPNKQSIRGECQTRSAKPWQN